MKNIKNVKWHFGMSIFAPVLSIHYSLETILLVIKRKHSRDEVFLANSK